MNEAAVGDRTTNLGWSAVRALCCWIGGGMLLLGGFILAVSPASWTNDVVAGVIGMAVSPILFPPILRRLRERLPALRPAWVPILMWIAIGPFATLAGLPFKPSPARQEQPKVEAIADANRLLAAGRLLQARARLSKFSGAAKRDPKVSAILAKIDAQDRKASSAPIPAPAATSQPATVATKTALNEPMQTPAENFAERLREYWIPEAEALPTTPPEGEAYGKLLSQIDGLAQKLEDGNGLALDSAQAKDRARFISVLAAKQNVLLPAMRKRYAEALAQKLFRDDIIVSSSGPGAGTLRFTGGAFARNANVEDMQQSMQSVLQRLRFHRVEYRWSRYLHDGYDYNLKPPADAAIGYWQGESFTRTDQRRPEPTPSPAKAHAHDPACVPALAAQVHMKC